MTVNEANDLLFELGHNDYDKQDINEICDLLNSENIYDCSTCFYVVENDISKSELLKVIYG